MIFRSSRKSSDFSVADDWLSKKSIAKINEIIIDIKSQIVTNLRR